MKEHTSFKNRIQDDSLDLREQFDKYFKFWPWFIICVILCLGVSFLYLRYTIPLYQATATILVKDEKKGSLESELTAFADLGLMKGVKSNVDNEIEIIKSRSIVKEAVKKLNFNVSYYTEGRIKKIELYGDKSPIDVSFFESDDTFYTKHQTFIVNSKTANTYDLNTGDGKLINTFNYGSTIRLGNCKMVVTKKMLADNQNKSNFSITVSVNNLDNIVQSYKGRLTIAPLNEKSSVVELTLTDPVAKKAEDLLNMIIAIYNQDAIDDKNYISRNTQKFIDERLQFITRELGDVEKEGESYMTSNRLTNVASDANLFIQNSVEFEKSLIETETQIKVVSSMLDYLNGSSKDDIIPSNLIPTEKSGGNNNNAADLINQYNGFIIERNRIVNGGGTSKNSVVINLNNRIDDMRKSVKESLNRLIASLKIKRSDLQAQDNLLNGKISEIPKQTRELNVIGRQQKIKESLYLYLLQKREEVGISLAVTSPVAKVIDEAKFKTAPMSPKTNLVLLAGLTLGLLIPFLIIYILDLFDTKIKNRQNIEDNTDIPFLGDIPKSDSEDEVISATSRSSSAEAIRIVRTNLEFMLNGVSENKAKTIFITSTIPKEGKTFVAINLASTIALTGRKVLLVGLDIRNPKIDKYLDVPDQGLTNYIVKSGQKIDDYIVKLNDFENLSVLPSGVIPPNPADLLLSPKIDEMFESIKSQYDYIIVDTAPVSLVTDTLLVAKYADVFIYIVRANYLDKRLLKIADSFYQEKKLPNMAILLNDTVWRKTYGYGNVYGYGYGYGYGADEEEKSWKDKLFKKK